MTETEKLQLACNVFAEQRNSAFVEVVNLRIQLAEAQEEIASLKQPKESNG